MKRTLLATAAIAMLTPAVLMADTKPVDPAVLNAVAGFAADVTATDVTTHKLSGGKTLAEFTRANVGYQIVVDGKGKITQVMETQSYRPETPDPRNEAISNVASLHEDLTEFALAGDRSAAQEAIGMIAKGLTDIHPLLNAKAAETVAANLKVIEAAAEAQDWQTVALRAVDGFGQLEGTLDTSKLTVPIDVSMLDYTGFKLSALAGSKTIDWSTVSATIDQSAKQWAALESQVNDKGLRDTLNSIHAGLNTALAEKDASQLAFGAHMELDVVDLLEHYFVAQYKTGTGALPILEDSK
ncbi:hypothetical protein [Pseudophaeobacter sp. 1A09344]|uniref:hypothetical protein n=1 Tax=Pseudophaeobacter sp. 1A09344 TaxID=3098144 RepID=UPI0034D40578